MYIIVSLRVYIVYMVIRYSNEVLCIHTIYIDIYHCTLVSEVYAIDTNAHRYANAQKLVHKHILQVITTSPR